MSQAALVPSRLETQPSDKAGPKVLTWGFIICTRNREPILVRALRLALTQTRKPAEVVIVDSSPDWEASSRRVREAVSPPESLRWIHVGSERGSLPHQRNLAIAHATADILFMFDDDTLMYPDCAEEVMRVYELDEKGLVGGVSACEKPEAPDVTAQPLSEESPAKKPVRRGLLSRIEARLVDGSARFLPYDGVWRCCALPAGFVPEQVAPLALLGGFRMTYRRDVIRRVGFAEYLEGYSLNEDFDASYRVSRERGLLMAWRARVHHLVVPGGRPNRRLKAALLLLNNIAMNLLHAPVGVNVRHRCRMFMLKRLAISLAIDLGRRRLSLPETRGTLLAWRHAPGLFRRRGAGLEDWYLVLQRQLLRQQ